MAETEVPEGGTVQQWDEKYFKEYLTKEWFRSFTGTGANKMIQVKEDLTKNAGDSVTFQLINKLKGEARNDEQDLEGNEEGADIRTQKVSVREYAHAVKFKKFSDQKTKIDLRKAHKSLLMDWNMELHRDNVIREMTSIDGKAFENASDSDRNTWLTNNSDRVLFGSQKQNTVAGNHSASLANIDNTADKLSMSVLGLMKRMAKNANPKIRPLRERASINKSDSYVVFAGSNAIRDLKGDAGFMQANREARERGLKNPIFSDADYVYDNMAIYELEDLPVFEQVGASNIDVSPVLLCGAQAISTAWAKRPETEDEEFDYGRKVGLAIMQWYEVEKLRFGAGESDTDNPKDHGILTGYFASVGDA